jgi:hypothetical protein
MKLPKHLPTAADVTHHAGYSAVQYSAAVSSVSAAAMANYSGGPFRDSEDLERRERERERANKWSGHISQAHDTHHVLLCPWMPWMTCSIVDWGPLHLAESPMMSTIEDVAPEYHFSKLVDLPVWISHVGSLLRTSPSPSSHHMDDPVVEKRRSIHPELLHEYGREFYGVQSTTVSNNAPHLYSSYR